MLNTLVRRFAQMAFVMFGISVLVFLIFFATPGVDPAARLAGRNASPEVLAAVRASFGLDQPLPIQYLMMMKKMFITQDLTSFVNRGQMIVPELVQAAPVTISLVVGSALLWVGLSIPIGMLAAAFKDRFLDRVLMGLVIVGISPPVFWLGEITNLITQSRYHDTWLFSWVPPLGYIPFSEDPWGWFKCLVLPCANVAVLYIGIYARLLRSNIIEANQQDFIRTARAKGLSEWQILFRHSLRTSLITFATLFGLDFGFLVGGGVLLTEVVFGLPGIGKLTYESLRVLDLPTIMGTVLWGAFFVVASNAIIDSLYAFIDPRARHAS
ncbi:MAG: ABC transporter permease [Azospirillaceae bacterium]|nr:ABC transporter permease [Azospirillaceae bacterium]